MLNNNNRVLQQQEFKLVTVFVNRQINFPAISTNNISALDEMAARCCTTHCFAVIAENIIKITHCQKLHSLSYIIMQYRNRSNFNHCNVIDPQAAELG